MAQLQEQLEEEQNKNLVVEKERRDLAGQVDVLREELENEQVHT